MHQVVQIKALDGREPHADTAGKLLARGAHGVAQGLRALRLQVLPEVVERRLLRIGAGRDGSSVRMPSCC